MVAYNFQKRFVTPIQKGLKPHTIRRNGKRAHVQRGGLIQLYTGMRTATCEKIIDDQRCIATFPIRIEIDEDRIALITVSSMPLDAAQMQRLAIADGFDDLSDMHGFFIGDHGTGIFEGVIIYWGEEKI